MLRNIGIIGDSIAFCLHRITSKSMSSPVKMETDQTEMVVKTPQPAEKMFTLKKWNLVAMWSWDVECDTCAICRMQVMDACLHCQSDNKQDDCVVVWGECNHSFHNCCMSRWVIKNNRCPLCQQEWVVQRTGK